MNEWHDFFVAIVGASAALTGLIFVGISINLTRILSFSQLPRRALLSLILISIVMVISMVLLIPKQTDFVCGVEVLLLGLFCWSTSFFISVSIIKKTDKQYKKAAVRMMILNQLSTLPYIIAAIFLLFNNENGLYFIAAAFIFCTIKAITDAWVLLIEINR